jgi:uncharacterized membrane protein YoaK (UPF0700 family)
LFILQSPLVLAAVCAFFFLAAGSHESRLGGENHGPLWAILSALLSAVVLLALHGTWGWLVIAQAGLFVGIGFFLAWRDS